MKLKFKHQKFKEEAAMAVCDVFAGQPYLSEVNYLIDRGDTRGHGEMYDFNGFSNHKIVPQPQTDAMRSTVHMRICLRRSTTMW